MLSVQDVVTDALWIVGLAGLLATFSYMNWYRRRQGWRWRYLFSLPRLLVPFCVSLELFCISLAVKGVVAYQPAPWWETIAWSILAVIFALQTVIYGWVGIRQGWDTPIDERADHERSRHN